MGREGRRIWGEVDRLDVVELSDMLTSVLLDNADAILVIDDDGTILAVNPAAERLLGKLAGDLVGSVFGHPIAGGTAVEVDIVGNGDRIAEIHVARTRWGGADVFIATLRDITERRKAEQQLRDFVSVASHELRTPATSIAGFATTLMDHYDELSDEERWRSLEIVARQARRLVGLATDLLELARLEGGRMESFPRAASVRTCIDMAIETSGVSDVAVEGDEFDVVVDDEHLVTILTNFLTNAGKYGAPPVTVSVQEGSEQFEVVVSDCGTGVPQEFRPRLFERFARAEPGHHRKVPGTGLGLSLSAALATLNGGECWYRPNEPEGSRFGLTLPVRPV